MTTTPSNPILKMTPAPRKKVRTARKKVAGIPIPAPPVEPGRDLSQVDTCADCGLEISNPGWHQDWHRQQRMDVNQLRTEISSIKEMLRAALEGTPCSTTSTLGSATPIGGRSTHDDRRNPPS